MDAVNPRMRTRDEDRRRADVAQRLERMVATCMANGMHRDARILSHAIEQLIEHDNPAYFNMLSRFRHTPVTIDEFVRSPEFLGDQITLWPALEHDLFSVCPDIIAGEPPVTEVLLGGATGIGKSFQANIITAYWSYFLTCIRRPQELFTLSRNTPIVFMMQSVSEGITKRVLYQPFRDMFTAMPYFKKWVNYEKYKEQALHIEGGIQIIPALASIQATVGQAIIGGILDEVNFMNIVEQSVQVVGNRGLGGKYDQAAQTHDTIMNRRKGRYISRGPVPGCIVVSSSTRYEGDFLDRRIKQAINNGEVRSETNPTGEVMAFTRKQYEVRPRDSYSGETFRLLVG